MKLILALLLFLSATSLVAATSHKSCHTQCRFRICDYRKRYNVMNAKADRPFTATICSKNKKYHIGTVDESGEALIKTYYKYKPVYTRISEYNPKGLKQSFSRSFFKAYSVRGYYWENKHGARFYSPKKNSGKYTPHKYSAVGRENVQQNQHKFLRNKCVILPLKKWQVLDKYGRRVVDNVNSKKPLRDCVAFEVYWD